MKHEGTLTTLLLMFAVILFPLDTVARQPFGIIDYSPSSYVELADEPFFYSTGKTLRYGRTINDSSPVVFKGSFFGGDLADAYIAPDNKKAAVVSNGNLYLATANEPARLLLENADNMDGTESREGDVFYKYHTIQWDAESRSIYIVRDKKKKARPYAQSDSPDATLVRIDIDSPTRIIEVIRDFRSWYYFFVNNDAICFNYPPGDGSVVWKCSQQGKVSRVKSHQNGRIVLKNGIVISGKPFVSYNGDIYEREIWFTKYGFSLTDSADGTTGLFSNSDLQKPILKIQGGKNFKGLYTDGVVDRGCRVLPGGRYILLNVSHDDFKGQLLVDGLSGKYRELPAKTRVYLNLNSLNYEHFKFKMGATKRPEFVPASRLRSRE